MEAHVVKGTKFKFPKKPENKFYFNNILFYLKI